MLGQGVPVHWSGKGESAFSKLLLVQTTIRIVDINNCE